MGSRRLTPGPTIRPARPGEAPLLSALAVRSKGYWGYPADFLERCVAELTVDAEAIREKALHCRVIAIEGDILGFYALALIRDRLVELEYLFVEPDHIGHGYGRALIMDAIALAAQLGARRIEIQGDPHARAFYLAAGGTEIGTRQSESIPGRRLPLFAIPVSLTDDPQDPTP